MAIIDRDSSKVFGPHRFPAVFVKSCKFEFSYILPDIFLKESFFPGCLKVQFMVPVFKKVEESFTTKTYCTISFLTVVRKVFEKVLSNKFAVSIKRYGFFIVRMVSGIFI